MRGVVKYENVVNSKKNEKPKISTFFSVLLLKFRIHRKSST